MEMPNRLFARRQRGSVLILVVVVVVLLALLGTALLSTSRGDRFTAQQHTYNTQVDILVESLKALSQGAIDNGLSGVDPNSVTLSKSLRPPTDTSIPPTAADYHNYDAVSLTANVYNLSDSFLSPRAPMLSPTPFPETALSTFRGSWASIGTFLIGSNFESPVVWNETLAKVDLGVSSKFTQTIGSNAVGQFLFEPTSFTLPIDGRPYPAFRKQINGVYYDFMAGDADGDGIADSGMFRIPVGQIDGVDYFAAVRIVDAASQVNLNTAWSRTGDYATGVQANNGNIIDATNTIPLTAATGFANNLGWFQSHVGLQEMLNRSDTFPAVAPLSTPYAFGGNWTNEVNASTEMLALNRFRFGYPSSQTNGLFAHPELYQDLHSADPSAPTTPWAAPGLYAAATFITQGDSLQHQLADRVRNPGLGLNAGTTDGSLTISNAVSLAYHGGLMVNPNVSKSQLESIFLTARSLNSGINSALPDSLYSSASNFRDNNTPFANGKAGSPYGFNANEMWRWLMDYYNTDATGARTVNDPTGTVHTQPYYPITNTSFPTYACVRPFLTTWNPTSNQIQKAVLPTNSFQAGPDGFMAAYRPTQSKVCVNTATFNEMWTAFWNVMADKQSGMPNTASDSFSPYGAYIYNTIASVYLGMTFNNVAGGSFAADPPSHPERMFRSSIRDFRTAATPVYFPPTDEIGLRSAIAAVQALQLRTDANANNKPDNVAPIAKTISLRAVDATGALRDLTVRIFGARPQPFFTEVYVQTDNVYNPNNNVNPMGYAAVELYNPFEVPITIDNTYELVAVGRTDTGVYPIPTWDPSMGVQNPTQDYWNQPIPMVFPNGGPSIVIQPHSFALIENYNAPTNPAGHRPQSSGFSVTPPAAGSIIAADLSIAYNKELVLRKRLGAAGSLTPIDYCPIDSFDLRVGVVAAFGVNSHTFHYCRASGTAGNNNWRCVYPGRYNAVPGAVFSYQQGVDSVPFAPNAAMDNDPWNTATGTGSPNAPIALLAADANPSWQNSAAPDKRTFTIPLGGNSDSPGPNPTGGGAGQFPFGAFAREGDLLQIPFIGAYTIQDQQNPAQFYEMNSIAMDAAFAEDTDVTDDEQTNTGALNSTKDANGLPIIMESIGRFAPIHDVDGVSSIVDDLNPNGSYTGTNNWRYRWATRLFDYLTVEAPSSDFLPNVDNAIAGLAGNPQPVDNDGDTVGNGLLDTTVIPNGNKEDIDPRQGLININTAPWQVLAALPMMKTGNNNTLNQTTGVWAVGADPVNIDDNTKLAKAIVRWRDGDPQNGVVAGGPFHSIFDLNNVPAFAGASGLLIDNPLGPTGPDASQGDFSPMVVGVAADPRQDWARFDYKEQYLLLNKVSNLITTRSDSFVVYILIQGWRNLTTKPELAVQRRAAFIQDRWRRTSTDMIDDPIPIPND